MKNAKDYPKQISVILKILSILLVRFDMVLNLSCFHLLREKIAIKITDSIVFIVLKNLCKTDHRDGSHPKVTCCIAILRTLFIQSSSLYQLSTVVTLIHFYSPVLQV